MCFNQAFFRQIEQLELNALDIPVTERKAIFKRVATFKEELGKAEKSLVRPLMCHQLGYAPDLCSHPAPSRCRSVGQRRRKRRIIWL